jgi:MYXO-CTERM domain-containing protein
VGDGGTSGTLTGGTAGARTGGAAGAAGHESSGCGCRTPRTGETSEGTVLTALLLALGFARRRRLSR